jgi:hypothetical protein
LTTQFIRFLYRLEHPFPQREEDYEGGLDQYLRDYLFHSKVDSVVAGTMSLVMQHMEETEEATPSKTVLVKKTEENV